MVYVFRSTRRHPPHRVSSVLTLVCTAAAGVLASACSGVATEAVRDSTAAITAQVALAKASLVACRGGDRAQCDSAEKNLEAVASSNAQLSQLAYH
ncbi:MAG: hypothetical protein ABW321_20825 [Polyangiales bacterium]